MVKIFKIIMLLCALSCSENEDSADTEKIFVNDIEREYILYIPESYDGKSKLPILLNFHGGGMDASGQLYISDMRSLADTENFILVYPEGLYGLWNVSLPSDPESKNNTDDIGFINTLIDQIASNYNIDTSRVYATGFSNGAGMSYTLACTMSNKIAAIVSMGGLLYKHTAENSKPDPVAIMSIHGTADQDRPYGGINNYYYSIDDIHDYWIDQNITNKVPDIISFNSNGQTVEYHSYKNGINNISIDHYKVIGGEHWWLDIEYEGLNTNRIIWDFVSKYDTNGLR